MIKRSSMDASISAKAKEPLAAIVRSEKAWKPKRADVLGANEEEIKLNASFLFLSLPFFYFYFPNIDKRILEKK